MTSNKEPNKEQHLAIKQNTKKNMGGGRVGVQNVKMTSLRLSWLHPVAHRRDHAVRGAVPEVVVDLGQVRGVLGGYLANLGVK